MPSTNDPHYHARYQRQLRERARQAGLVQVASLVPSDLVARLDAIKKARGLRSRDAVLAAVLREYFAHDEIKEPPP